MMRAASWGLLATGIAMMATGCGIATTAGADFRPGVDFSRYTTYGWDQSAIRRTGDTRLENNPFFEDDLYAGVNEQLANRGIVHTDENPQLLVHYHLSVQDHIEVFERNPESGYPAPSEYGQGTDVVQYQEGVFILHFVDASTGDNLWVGWARGDIGDALTSAEKMREWVNDAVEKMFRDFPIN
jgi:Domain of unknown function (DUF4136)